MTYSILGIDRDAGEIGVAVQSHYFAVGALVTWATAGVGVVATQSVGRAEYGPELLAALAAGEAPSDALARAVDVDPGRDLRQVAVMGVDGRGAGHTGTACIAACGQAAADDARAQANLVVGDVWTPMLEAFAIAEGSLADRLISALEAAQSAGGDLRGQQSAAIKVVRTVPTGDWGSDVIVDLRVDDHPEPLRELRRLHVVSGGLSGLLGLLESPGLLSGAMTAPPEVVDAALAELRAAQQILGPDNGEPSAWAGLLLARLGRDDEARAAFARATTAGPDVRPLLRSLAGAGMWTGRVEDLTALAPEPARPASP